MSKEDNGTSLKVTVTEEAVFRLDVYLAERFTYRSRSQWQKSIRKGYISVNSGQVLQPSFRIKAGDLVTLTTLHRPEPEVDREYQVLYEDSYLCAVSKSGDMPVHPAGPYRVNTLTSMLERERGYQFYPVHRLDRETSGVILLAKRPDIAAQISEVWSSVHKEYRALVRGTFTSPVCCTVPLGPAYGADDMRDSIVRKKRAARPGAPESGETSFSPILPGPCFSLIAAVLHTGRRHQIRAHCEYLGYPIVGDKIYGGDETIYIDFIEKGMTPSILKRAGLKRCALHSHILSFKHPVTGNEVALEAPLPDDMRAFIDNKLGPQT